MDQQLPYGTTPTWPPPAHADEITPPGFAMSPEQLADRFGTAAVPPSGEYPPVAFPVPAANGSFSDLLEVVSLQDPKILDIF